MPAGDGAIVEAVTANQKVELKAIVIMRVYCRYGLSPGSIAAMV